MNTMNRTAQSALARDPELAAYPINERGEIDDRPTHLMTIDELRAYMRQMRATYRAAAERHDPELMTIKWGHDRLAETFRTRC
ncbi:MAG: hypothetical protein LC687_00035 [Actinobacteria bacterium]|nr:hypothetical protein [Actinomycetota bacterium]